MLSKLPPHTGGPRYLLDSLPSSVAYLHNKSRQLSGQQVYLIRYIPGSLRHCAVLVHLCILKGRVEECAEAQPAKDLCQDNCRVPSSPLKMPLNLKNYLVTKTNNFQSANQTFHETECLGTDHHWYLHLLLLGYSRHHPFSIPPPLEPSDHCVLTA